MRQLTFSGLAALTLGAAVPAITAVQAAAQTAVQAPMQTPVQAGGQTAMQTAPGSRGAPQTATGPQADAFSSDNAVLDTSIPFAIGAREARQELRGAFGWPTFQEGLVGGVYFRFDPDGYARFAPTPRLDTDIFEVICRPRTLSCMGRKDGLSLFLNTRGQFELQLEEVIEGDTLHMAEGVSEIQLPEQVLMPLTAQLETLLSSGGELVHRRDGEEQARISLTGFGAVAAYLRWVAARQDYTVLPRDWPVPNAVDLTEGGRLTQPQAWASPMPQPQARPMLPAGGALPASGPDTATEVAEVRGELNLLREILLQRTGAAGATGAGGTDDGAGGVAGPAAPDENMTRLEARVMQLQRQIDLARMDEIGLPDTAPAIASPGAAAPGTDADTDTAGGQDVGQDGGWAERPGQSAEDGPGGSAGDVAGDGAGDSAGGSEQARLARQLSYLMTEIGLDPQTAVMLLQMRQGGTPGAAAGSAGDEAGQVGQDVAGLLGTLGVTPPLAPPAVPTASLPAAPPSAAPLPAAPVAGGTPPASPLPAARAEVTQDEFRLLTDYFRSVFAAPSVPAAPAPAAVPVPVAPSAGVVSAAPGDIVGRTASGILSASPQMP
ncbi:hypothetical protein EKE94_18050 [Mesobaculum littorinae]|uniref:Uncharacterized protein n=1 Tax=Mesobaculum littorinae TaxID=2486419 RepID=A0A438ACZ3_9RHOB|nr:hypothetical protein [Mesobaculum littorinae]RVV96549.1 hypothetical protein EKE94_18050 [Mesobaculum littorinae]